MTHGKTERARSVAFPQSTSGLGTKDESSIENAAAAFAHADQFPRPETPSMNANLLAMQNKIARALAIRPECFITHPTELRVLTQLSRGELESFALENGWHTVSRLGGRQIEFYNDASAQPNL